MIEIQKILKNFESINDQDILSIKDKIPNLLYCLKFEEIEYDDEKNKLICQKNNKSSKTQLTDFVKLWKDNNIFDEIKPYTRIFFDNGHNYEIKIKDVNQINESNNLIPFYAHSGATPLEAYSGKVTDQFISTICSNTSKAKISRMQFNRSMNCGSCPA